MVHWIAAPRTALAVETEQPNQKSVNAKEVYGAAIVRDGVPPVACFRVLVRMTLGVV